MVSRAIDCPNAADRFSAVSVSCSRPAATTWPSDRIRQWLKPGGISSTWWVTRTSAGRVRVGSQVGQPGDEFLAAAEIQSGGGFVEQQQFRVGHQ